MAISWGAWEYSGGNGMRVGIEVDWDPVANGDSSATATVRYYTENQYGYGDGQTLNTGGALSGSFGFNNDDGGAPVLRKSRSYSVGYSSTSYGTSPGTRTFTASVSGAYNGVTPSKSLTVSIPARPTAAPLAPTGESVSRTSDTSQRVTWTNRETDARPWDSVIVHRSVLGGAWSAVATLGGSASAYSDPTSANRRYRYRVYSRNDKGTAGPAETGDIYTSPVTPSNAIRVDLGASQRIEWSNSSQGSTPAYTQYVTEVWAIKNGDTANPIKLADIGSDGSTSDTVANSQFVHDASTPAAAYTSADRWRYKVRHRTSIGAALYSGYSNETDETAGVTLPPLAPTQLSPNSTTIDPERQQQFTWQHNSDPEAVSAQTEAGVRWRVSGASDWQPEVTIVGAGYWLAPIDTFDDAKIIQWQVRTKGADPVYGPWSEAATFNTAVTPIAADPVKVPLQLDLFTGQIEASFQASEVSDYVMRAQSQLMGGGIKTVAASTYACSWSQPFLATTLGRSQNTFPFGVHEIGNPQGWGILAGSVISGGVITFNVNVGAGANKMRLGETVQCANSVVAALNGVPLVVRGIRTSQIICDAPVGVPDQSIGAGGGVYPLITGHGGATSIVPLTLTTVLGAWQALYYELPFGWGAGATPRKNGVVKVLSYSQSTTTGTLNVVTPHYFAVGDRILISGVHANFDGERVINGITADGTITVTLSVSATIAGPVTAGAGALAQPTGKDTFYGNFHLVDRTADFTVPDNWLLLAVRNSDLSAVEWATGEVVDAGYTSDIYNIGGQKIRKFNFGSSGLLTSNSSSQVAVPHGLGQTPSQVLVAPGGSGASYRIANVGVFTSTTFTVTIRNASDNALPGSGADISFYFAAIAE